MSLDKFFDGLNGPAPEGDRRVRDFDPTPWLDVKQARRADRFQQFSVAAAQMALDDAGDVNPDPARAGVIFGTGVGGLQTLETQIQVHIEKGPRRVSPFLVPMLMANAGAAAISMRLGWRGPCETVVTACAAGTQSIGAAYRLVAWGRCDVVMTGGAEAAMTRVAHGRLREHDGAARAQASRGRSTAGATGSSWARGVRALVLEELGRATSSWSPHLRRGDRRRLERGRPPHNSPAARWRGSARLHGARPRRRRRLPG